MIGTLYDEEGVSFKKPSYG
jgi:hypothetical protein